jgi:predicted nucleotidyltransferase
MDISPNPNRDEIVTTLRELQSDLVACGIVGLAIFGSRARGDNGNESDLDVLVDVQPDRKFSLIDLIGVSQKIGDRLGLPANMFMRRSLEARMAESIRADIIEVFHE